MKPSSPPSPRRCSSASVCARLARSEPSEYGYARRGDGPQEIHCIVAQPHREARRSERWVRMRGHRRVAGEERGRGAGKRRERRRRWATGRRVMRPRMPIARLLARMLSRGCVKLRLSPPRQSLGAPLSCRQTRGTVASLAARRQPPGSYSPDSPDGRRLR